MTSLIYFQMLICIIVIFTILILFLFFTFRKGIILLVQLRLQLIDDESSTPIIFAILSLFVGGLLSHVNHNSQLRSVKFIIIEQKMMSPSFYTQTQHNSVQNISLPGCRQKRERLLKIEQKLEAITLLKQNQVKDQTEDSLTRRVLEIEQRYAEQVKNMEAKVRQLREGLSEIKLRESELCKKCDFSKKTRLSQIRQLQKKLIALVSCESKERKDLENSLFSILEKRDKQLVEELSLIKETRIEQLNRFEGQLGEELPQLGYEIQSKLSEEEARIECLHQKVRSQVESLRERVEKEDLERQRELKTIMESIAKVTLEVKNQLCEQKKVRQSNKVKLMNLFQNAYGKLNLL